MLLNGEINPDRAYPILLNLLPMGMKGLAFAALTAAIVASLAGKANSIATIFSLDIYKKNIAPNASEENIVKIGKITVVVAMILAIIIAPNLGIDKKGGFQLIQEYTGFLSPGIFAMFLLGFFWKKTNSAAALFATIGGFLFSIFLKFLPNWIDLSALSSIGFSSPNANGIFEIPFLDRMLIVFLFCVIGMIGLSYLLPKENETKQAIVFNKELFKVHTSFKIGAIIILLLLVFLYGYFW
jgi:SSS family solute:Na+ symporter